METEEPDQNRSARHAADFVNGLMHGWNGKVLKQVVDHTVFELLVVEPQGKYVTHLEGHTGEHTSSVADVLLAQVDTSVVQELS